MDASGYVTNYTDTAIGSQALIVKRFTLSDNFICVSELGTLQP